ncbi:MAG: ATP-binding cassette domain-containing protein [Dehalococcoidia bacterium]
MNQQQSRLRGPFPPGPPPVPAVVFEALRLVELDPVVYGGRDPFTLSGGEQRRLALAVLLARHPRILIMDEPSAGLDEPGRRSLYASLERVRREQGTGVVLVSHDLEEVAEVAEQVIVLHDGRVSVSGPVADVLQNAAALRAAGLAPPALVRLRDALAQRGFDIAGNWAGIDAASTTLVASARAGAADRAAGHA